jgi:uncharacterized protein (UPF0335 family)
MTTAARADGQLLAIVERIERLSEEKKTIGEDINDVYAEAKSSGYDVKALKAIVRERKQDVSERAEHETIMALYRRALGMLDGTPLGNAAIERANAPAVRAAASGGSRGRRGGGVVTPSEVRMAG